MIQRACFCLMLLSSSTALAGAESLYLDQVKPLLRERCVSCHGPLAHKGNLRLDNARALIAGGESGPAVVPGKATASSLIARVTAADPAERMPPEGKPLTAAEVDLLRRWIDAGARSPADERPAADPKSHWAFQPPVRPRLPVVPRETAWTSRNPIDEFIGAAMASRGLTPVDEADRATLLRRVTLDLIGVPPTPEDVNRFLTSSDPEAYEREVDRLLNDPRYGERWGRHWMDVWRYSDWYGRRSVPDVMNSYPHIWRWRDWIVQSLNSDRGYDSMVQAMLAADELSPGDDSEVVATGFLVRNWFKWNYESWMKDNVEHTGKAFLGLTLNCCQCHDHKYDPISQREYFQFRAFFEPLELRQDRVPGLPDPGPFQKYVYAKSYGPIKAGLIRVFDEKLEAQTFLFSKGDARARIEGEPPAEPLVPAFLQGDFQVAAVELTPEAYYPGLKPFVRQEELEAADSRVAAAQAEVDRARASAADARLQLADARSQASQPATAAAPPKPEALLTAELTSVKASDSLQLAESRLNHATAARDSLRARIAADDAKYRSIGNAAELAKVAALAERRAAWLGAVANRLAAEQAVMNAEQAAAADEKLKPAIAGVQKQLDAARAAADAARIALAATGETYTPLSPVYPSRSTGRRAALARWIASEQNPLTARVAVNHLWMRHFGRGLVESPSNFGLNGKAPSHPELLDWLAMEFMDHGWQMKHLHRLMVTSHTYRLRSTTGAEPHPSAAVDPENVFLWKANPRRMEAEVVRDSVLAAAGTLDDTVGGQELDHALGLSARRRSLYFASHGESQMQFLDLFDGPAMAECYQRTSSVVPQQALSMANSQLVHEQSLHLAGSLWKSVSSGEDAPREFIRRAFPAVLSRPASDDELRLSEQFLVEQSQLLEQEPPPPKESPATGKTPAERAREDFIHALFNHNDFVTIR